MVGRPTCNATLSLTLRFIKTDDRPLWVCDDNLKIDCEHIFFLFYSEIESEVCVIAR